MAKYTGENIELHFHVGNGVPPPGGGWFYYYGPKPTNRRRFGTCQNPEDKASYEASYEEAKNDCMIWLWMQEVSNAIRDRINAMPGLSEYKFKKLLRDNIRACEVVTITDLDDVYNALLPVFDNVIAGDFLGGIFPTLALKGEGVYYKLDLIGILGLDWDTVDSLIMDVDDFIDLWRLVFIDAYSKFQQIPLELLGDLTSVGMVEHTKDYPLMWDNLIRRWPHIVSTFGDHLDAWHADGLIEHESVKPPQVEGEL